MNTTTTTNPGQKDDDKKAAMPVGAVNKTDVCATTAAKSESCATSAGKSDACAKTDEMPEACGNTHDGKVVNISGDKLVMSGHDGKQHTHTVATDAKVCCDGAVCRTEDLKAGHKIRVTTKTGDKHTAVKIESLNKHAEFAKSA